MSLCKKKSRQFLTVMPPLADRWNAVSCSLPANPHERCGESGVPTLPEVKTRIIICLYPGIERANTPLKIVQAWNIGRKGDCCSPSSKVCQCEYTRVFFRSKPIMLKERGRRRQAAYVNYRGSQTFNALFSLPQGRPSKYSLLEVFSSAKGILWP